MHKIDGGIKKSARLFAITAFLVLWQGGGYYVAYAGSDSNSVSVSASVNSKCMFKTGNGPASNTVTFGEYDPVVINATIANDSVGGMDVKCTRGSPAQISLDNGSNESHAVGTTRAMSDGMGHYLSYDLYTNAGRSTVWNSSNTVSYSDAGGGYTTVQAYGAISPGQDAYAGTYTDNVTMTISY